MEKKKKRKRLIEASEYEKIFERRNNSNDESDDNSVEFVEEPSENSNTHGENNNVNNDDDDDAAPVENLISEWTQAFNALEEVGDDEEEEDLSPLQIAQDVHDLKYSDGSEFRDKNPLPNWNDPNVKQEKLRKTRNTKIDLATLFPGSLVLSDIELDS